MTALDHTTTNTNLASQSLLSGDVNGTIDGTERIAVNLAEAFSDNTPLEEVTGNLPTNIGNTAFFVQDASRVVDLAASNPLADGGLLVPLLGLFTGQGSVVPLSDSLPPSSLPLSGLQCGAPSRALSGLELAELPLPAGNLDPATLTALMDGVPLAPPLIRPLQMPFLGPSVEERHPSIQPPLKNFQT